MATNKTHWTKSVDVKTGGLHMVRNVKVHKEGPPRYTLCQGHPGYDARYTVPPGEQPYGAGFAAAGIGRDSDGRIWDER